MRTTTSAAPAQLGVASSTASDPERAGAEAVAAVSTGVVARDDIVLVFADSLAEDAMRALHHGALEAADGARVVGCSTAGAFTHSDNLGKGVVALRLPATDVSFGVGVVDDMAGDLLGSARRAVTQARDEAGEHLEHSVAMILTDGLAGDQREIVRGAYEATGALVPLVGGAAGDDLRLRQTYQLAAGRTLTRGVVALWINSARPLGVGVRHGWRPSGPPMVVTGAHGNVITELDGRPARAVYEAATGVALESARGNAATAARERPLGLPHPAGRFDVRHVMAVQGDVLAMFGHVPEQTVVQVMSGDVDGLLDGARHAGADARAAFDGVEPHGAVVFSCAARIAPLGDAVAEEARAVSAALGGVPVGGFYTYGEFARVTGSTGFHNATVAVLAL